MNTVLDFLERSAAVYPDREAYEDEKKLLTFRSKLQKNTLTPEQREQASKRIQAYNNSK